jgi:carbamate kinase
MIMKRLLIAIGGNALVKNGQVGTFEEQHENLKVPISQIAQLCRDYRIVITHGNGPQVGSILLQQESTDSVPRMPLEICVAQTQGQIGYMIESTLDNELMKIDRDMQYLFVTVLTYVRIDPKDPAFKDPTKPIGPYYSEQQTRSRPYRFIKTPRGYRRVVASPRPITVVEKREIAKLIENGFIVIACGGGGIPVTKEGRKFEGAEAVIDKDLASAKLAEEVGINVMLIATDVEKVALNYGKPNQMDLDQLTIEQAKRYLDEGQFGEGSMKPKIEAAVQFLEVGGERAIITSTDKILQALDGKTGTEIVRQ